MIIKKVYTHYLFNLYHNLLLNKHNCNSIYNYICVVNTYVLYIFYWHRLNTYTSHNFPAIWRYDKRLDKNSIIWSLRSERSQRRYQPFWHSFLKGIVPENPWGKRDECQVNEKGHEWQPGKRQEEPPGEKVVYHTSMAFKKSYSRNQHPL